MGTLMELTREYESLIEFGDSLDPDDEQVFLDTLEGLTGEIGIKADSYAAVLQTMKSKEYLFREEAERLMRHADSLNANRGRIKEALIAAMQRMGVKKLDGEYHTFRLAKNGGKQPLQITGTVPENYKRERVVQEDDKDKIREDLENGIALSFAQLGDRGVHLRID